MPVCVFIFVFLSCLLIVWHQTRYSPTIESIHVELFEKDAFNVCGLPWRGGRRGEQSKYCTYAFQEQSLECSITIRRKFTLLFLLWRQNHGACICTSFGGEYRQKVCLRTFKLPCSDAHRVAFMRGSWVPSPGPLTRLHAKGSF